MNVAIYAGSIFDVDADAIVNPANSFLRHGAGLARAIADAAGPLLEEQSRKHPTIPTGSVTATTAGHLPYKAVIHAVGPVWGGGDFYERELLRKVHNEILKHCLFMEYHSVAIPAISCGLFRFPVEEAAPIAVGAAEGWPIAVTFALTDSRHIEAFEKALWQEKNGGVA